MSKFRSALYLEHLFTKTFCAFVQNKFAWRGIMHACSTFMLIVILLFHDYRQSSVNVKSILFSGNETSLSQCNYTLGTCQYHQEQASLLCRQAGLTPGTSAMTLHM